MPRSLHRTCSSRHCGAHTAIIQRGDRQLRTIHPGASRAIGTSAHVLVVCAIAPLDHQGASPSYEGSGSRLLAASLIHFIHQLTESQTAASFEIGARERLIPFNEILTNPSTPKAIKDSGDHTIPVQFNYKGKEYDYRLVPDGWPFGIAYSDGTYRFFVFETDCASEPLVSSNRDRQAIETKLAAYLTILEQELYETHFGLPNLTILFTSTTQKRVNNMIALLGGMSAKYLNCFGFQVFPTIISDSKQPEPGWAVKRPWTQVHGHLNLGEP